MRTCRWLLFALLVGCGFDTAGLGVPPIADASVIAPVRGADRPDALVSTMIDAPTPPDARPPDARPPDAAPDACGGLLEKCCEPGDRCNLGVCIAGGCVSLSQ